MNVVRSVMARDRMIWIPAAIMKQPLKTSAEPITSMGIASSDAETLGRKARSRNQPAIDQAIVRLVAPVVFSAPTSDGPALRPGAQSSPPIAQPTPSARMPPRMRA